MESSLIELLLPGESADAEQPHKQAPTRLRDGNSARAINNQLIQEDRRRSHRRALTKAMIDGAKPFPEDASGMTNLNFLDGRAIMAQSGVPYYAIFNGVRNYAEIRPSFQPEHPDHDRWGDTISKRFHELLSDWDGFDWHVQQASYQMRLHGIGPCYRDKTGDWRFRSVESGMVLVPAGSPSCVDERLPLVVIRIPYRVHELFAFIKDENSARDAGWNPDAVKRAIQNSCRDQGWAQTMGGGVASWETFERMFNSNDLLPSITGRFIYCAHILVLEYSGRISKFVITENEVPLDVNSVPNTAMDDQFLFQSIDCYEDYDECLVVFFKDIGDGTWHSVKGYASDAFDSLVVNNQLYCAMIDAARVDSTILLEFQTTAQRDKFDKFQVKRGITKLPVGATVRQARLQGSMDGAMQIAQLLSTKLNNNIGNFQGRGMSREDGKGETVTAREVDARVAKEASLNQGEMTLFYSYLDNLYEEIYEHAADPNTTDKDAMDFQEKCIQDGVPPEALLDVEYVKANRESGYGSPAMRQLILEQLTEIAPSLPTEGQQNLLDMRISATAGPDKVRLLNPREHIPNQDDWFANVENGQMRGGVEPLMVSGQDDIVHLHSHLEDAANYLEPIKQALDQGQNDPAQLDQAVTYTELMAAHCEQHLGRVLADPIRAGEGKTFKKSLANIVSFNGRLRGALISAQKEAELAAQEQQTATALGALDQAKVQSVQTHNQLAAAKTASKIQNDNLKVANKLKLDQIQAAAKINLDRKTAAAKVVLSPERNGK